jgi:hypothetical protein
VNPPETLEDAIALIKELEQKTNNLESSQVALKATNQGLLKDLKKKKTVDSFIKVAGLDLSGDLDEEALAERLAPILKAATTEPPKPQEQPPASPQGQSPSDVMDEAVKAQFASLRTELANLRKTNEDLEKEKNLEKDKRRQSKLEALVTEELAKVECTRPKHVFKLQQDSFRLLDDESTVVFGSEQDPIALRDAVTRLRDDEEYSIYFRGSGATGSGMTTSRAPAPTYTNNPFNKDSANATEAARLLNSDPDKAKRLIQDARLAGKLDPVISRALQSM